jgi:predicted GIY-YIG superfamily endonuclease
MGRTFHVYIMASKSGVLYVGVTSNLFARTMQHKAQQIAASASPVPWSGTFREIRRASSGT